jgi:hypothetical protein
MIFPGVDYAECLSNAKLTTLYERRTVCTLQSVFSNMMLAPHKRNAFVPPPPQKTRPNILFQDISQPASAEVQK